jgi:hypothetical protein
MRKLGEAVKVVSMEPVYSLSTTPACMTVSFEDFSPPFVVFTCISRLCNLVLSAFTSIFVSIALAAFPGAEQSRSSRPYLKNVSAFFAFRLNWFMSQKITFAGTKFTKLPADARRFGEKDFSASLALDFDGPSLGFGPAAKRTIYTLLVFYFVRKHLEFFSALSANNRYFIDGFWVILSDQINRHPRALAFARTKLAFVGQQSIWSFINRFTAMGTNGVGGRHKKSLLAWEHNPGFIKLGQRCQDRYRQPLIRWFKPQSNYSTVVQVR